MGKLFVVGVGSGNIEDMTIKSDIIIKTSDFVYCDSKLYENIKKYYDVKKIIPNEYTATLSRCINAINSAKNNVVSILGSGDTGIYGIAGIVLDKIDELGYNIEVEIIPGITSAISGGSLLGSPLTQDFAIISLSDNLADKNQLFKKISMLASINICIVFYSPSNPTKENLKKVREILMKGRDRKTLVGIANNIGMVNQNTIITNLEEMNINDITSFSTIFVGNSTTHIIKTQKLVTRLY